MNTKTTRDVGCPSASAVAQEAEGPTAFAEALWDLAVVADAAGAEALEVVLDLRQHAAQSLLQPGLAGFQGPALCIHVPGNAPQSGTVTRGWILAL